MKFHHQPTVGVQWCSEGCGLVEAEVVGIRLQPGEVAASTKPCATWPWCGGRSSQVKTYKKWMENDGNSLTHRVFFLNHWMCEK